MRNWQDSELEQIATWLYTSIDKGTEIYRWFIEDLVLPPGMGAYTVQEIRQKLQEAIESVEVSE